MTDEIVRLRIPYTQEFVRKGHRKTESVRFRDDGAVAIRVVDPDAAPVAYRISTVDHPLYPLISEKSFVRAKLRGFALVADDWSPWPVECIGFR